jgi:hypothetical protein
MRRGLLRTALRLLGTVVRLLLATLLLTVLMLAALLLAVLSLRLALGLLSSMRGLLAALRRALLVPVPAAPPSTATASSAFAPLALLAVLTRAWLGIASSLPLGRAARNVLARSLWLLLAGIRPLGVRPLGVRPRLARALLVGTPASPIAAPVALLGLLRAIRARP